MGKHYDSETKAAVMSALLAGQSVSSIAREYKLPKGTVSNWKRAASNMIDGVQPKRTQKSAEIGELLLQYLSTNLTTLRIQSEQFQDKQWLAKQNAADAAVLHGVLTDKSVRLIEAMAASVPDDNTTND